MTGNGSEAKRKSTWSPIWPLSEQRSLNSFYCVLGFSATVGFPAPERHESWEAKLNSHRSLSQSRVEPNSSCLFLCRPILQGGTTVRKRSKPGSPGAHPSLPITAPQTKTVRISRKKGSWVLGGRGKTGLLKGSPPALGPDPRPLQGPFRLQRASR